MMENTSGGFDRANNQGQNHDKEGNVANVDNENLKTEEEQDDKDLAKKIPTVTPGNDNEELEDPSGQNPSNKGQGPAGEDL